MAKILTAASVKKLLPGGKRIEIPDGGSRGSGLRLVIQVSGHKSWAMRFRRPDGRSANLTLGPADLTGNEMAGEPIIGQALTLAGARKLAADINRQRAMGRDPVADFNSVKRRRNVEREERTVNAFGAAAKAFITEHAKVKTRSWATTARLLGLRPESLEPFPKGLVDRWRDKSVAEVTSDDVHHLVDEIRERGIPGLARRRVGVSDSVARMSLARLNKFFGWLVERRLVEKNPCVGVHRPDASTPRERVLTDLEIRWFWRACGQVGEPFDVLLRLLLLTGQRRSEVAKMTRAELNGDTWSLPASRTKNKRAHTVPLSRQAQDLIASIHRIDGDLIFTTNGKTPVSGWSKVKHRLDARMMELARAEDATVPSWTIHDLRRTCATNLQKLGIRLEVTEAVLNHSSGTRAGIVGVYQKYQYGDEKRAALDAWADTLDRIKSGT